MEDVSAGMTGLMIDGDLVGKKFSVEDVSGDSLTVLVDEGDGCGYSYHQIPRDQFRVYDPHATPSDTCPYQLGDTVFIHQSKRAGYTGLVTGVSERYSRLVLHIDGETVVEPFHSVLLVSPPRRDVLPDCLVAIEKAHAQMGYSLREDSWWLDQLRQHGPWDSDEKLLQLPAAFERFQRELQAEQEAELQRKQREFTEAFGPLSHEERVERWGREFAQWVDWQAASSRLLAELARRYCTPEELKSIEEDAVQRGQYAFPQLFSEPYVSEERIRTHGVEQHVFSLITEGFALKRSMERAQRRVPLWPRYASWRSKVLPDEETLAESRRQARARVMGSAEALRLRILQSHGLLLPDHVLEFWACWRGLYPSEQKALAFLGVEPMGLLDFFLPTAEQPDLEDSDPRMHGRDYRDPPEFFSLLRVGQQIRYGLWYDDTRALPRFIVRMDQNDGRASVHKLTLLEVLRDYLEELMKELEFREPGEDDWMWLQYALARDAVAAFATASAPSLPPSGYRLSTQDGVGALLLVDGAMDERGLEKLQHRYLPDDPEDLRRLIRDALADCAAGDPARALLYGRDFHWESCLHPEREEAAVRLLEAAYRAQGRTGLAELVVLHHQHRRRPPSPKRIRVRA
jgi:hypothetical protein